MLLFLSCEPEDTNDINPFDLPPTIDGNWVLYNTTGVSNGVNHDFAPNQVRWSFRIFNNRLNVVNNNLSGGVQDGPSTGEYNFELTKQNGEEYLFIQNVEWGWISELTDSTLVLDQRQTIGEPINNPHILTFGK